MLATWNSKKSDYVPLIEDYNIPRAADHAVGKPADIPVVKYLFQSPD